MLSGGSRPGVKVRLQPHDLGEHRRGDSSEHGLRCGAVAQLALAVGLAIGGLLERCGEFGRDISGTWPLVDCAATSFGWPTNSNVVDDAAGGGLDFAEQIAGVDERLQVKVDDARVEMLSGVAGRPTKMAAVVFSSDNGAQDR